MDVYQTGQHQLQSECQRSDYTPFPAKPARRRGNPNDHVNMGQSSNDVLVPTAIQVSVALMAENKLLPALTPPFCGTYS
ncbi:lyase family protein [Vibrio lentus]|nr:lyase family protein [Vibrio lentus]